MVNQSGEASLSKIQEGAGQPFNTFKFVFILGFVLSAVATACNPVDQPPLHTPATEEIATGVFVPTEIKEFSETGLAPTLAQLPTGINTSTVEENTTTPTVQVASTNPAVVVIPWPTNTSQPTLAQAPGLNFKPPLPAILIDTPGQLSKIGSPIVLRSYDMPGDDGIVYFSVVNEGGKDIYSRQVNLSDSLYKHTYLKDQIEFTIQAAAETARVSIFTRDYYGRLQSLNSVDVVLLQMGEDLITPSSIQEEPYIIQQPLDGQIMTRGKIRLKGYVRPVNHSPLTITLVDQKGNVVGTQEFPVTFMDSQQPYQLFSVEMNYSISSETRVRMQVFQQSDNRLPGIVALNSLQLVLRP